MTGILSGRWTRRGLALASCLSLLAAQAATYVHLATVRHVTCPEHGELVELGRSEVPQQAAALPGLTERASDAAEGAHHHDHCLFGVHVRTGATAPAPLAVVATSTPSFPPAISEGVHTPPAPDLLAAPKQSPPQV